MYRSVNWLNLLAWLINSVHRLDLLPNVNHLKTIWIKTSAVLFKMLSVILLGCLILIWYFYERLPLITKGYHCWQFPSSKPLLSKFKPNVLIKHYFFRRKISPETKTKFHKYYLDSAPTYGMVQKWFVVAVRAQKPYQVQFVQMRSLYQKW